MLFYVSYKSFEIKLTIQLTRKFRGHNPISFGESGYVP